MYQLRSVERLDVRRNVWENVGSMAQARSALSACACPVSLWEAPAGLHDSPRGSSQSSQPQTASAQSAQTLIFAFGGYDGNRFLDSVEVYDPARDVWSALTEPNGMTHPRSGHAVTCCIAPSTSSALAIAASALGTNATAAAAAAAADSEPQWD